MLTESWRLRKSICSSVTETPLLQIVTEKWRVRKELDDLHEVGVHERLPAGEGQTGNPGSLQPAEGNLDTADAHVGPGTGSRHEAMGAAQIASFGDLSAPCAAPARRRTGSSRSCGSPGPRPVGCRVDDALVEDRGVPRCPPVAVL